MKTTLGPQLVLATFEGGDWCIRVVKPTRMVLLVFTSMEAFEAFSVNADRSLSEAINARQMQVRDFVQQVRRRHQQLHSMQIEYVVVDHPGTPHPAVLHIPVIQLLVGALTETLEVYVDE